MSAWASGAWATLAWAGTAWASAAEPSPPPPPPAPPLAAGITLDQVKRDLRVTHDEDDELLQIHLEGSIDEALRYMGRTQLPTLPVDYPPEFNSSSELISEDVPSSEDPVAPSARNAVLLLVRSKYDAATPQEIQQLRQCAETLLAPYRVGWGI